jgi:hypothetical protein
MTPRLEPRIARQAEVDTQCRHCSGGGACLLSGHQLPNHESPSLTSSTGGEAIAPDGGIAGEKHVATHYRRSSSVWWSKGDDVSRLATRSTQQLMVHDTPHEERLSGIWQPKMH